MTTFYNNFIKLCNEHNTNTELVLKDIGVLGEVFMRKSVGDSIGSFLLKVADYFGVSVESLLREVPKSNTPQLIETITDIQEELNIYRDKGYIPAALETKLTSAFELAGSIDFPLREILQTITILTYPYRNNLVFYKQFKLYIPADSLSDEEKYLHYFMCCRNIVYLIETNDMEAFVNMQMIDKCKNWGKYLPYIVKQIEDWA